MVARPRTIAAGAVAIALAATGLAFAQQSPEELIFARQNNKREIAGAYREIREELKKPNPMAFLLEDYANQLIGFTKLQVSWFPKGTGPESGHETGAKAEIWTSFEDFKTLGEASDAEAQKLHKLIMAGDKAGAAAQLQATAQACKNCHDKYKVLTEHEFQF